MEALKVNFGGRGAVSIDWGSKVTNGTALAQRAGVAIMTERGSDRFLPTRGTDVAEKVFGYGVFDLMSMQHALNFGALKARADMQDYEDPSRADVDRVDTIRMSLIGVKQNSAEVGIVVTNQAGQTTQEITTIS